MIRISPANTTNPDFSPPVRIRPATHLHFIVWAYEDSQGDSYHDNSVLDIIAETSEEALRRARAILQKPCYRIHQVIEHIDGQPCGKG